jgi:hypothetical protein
MTSRVKMCSALKKYQCLIDGSPETKEVNMMLMEISLDILQDVAN